MCYFLSMPGLSQLAYCPPVCSVHGIVNEKTTILNGWIIFNSVDVDVCVDIVTHIQHIIHLLIALKYLEFNLREELKVIKLGYGAGCSSRQPRLDYKHSHGNLSVTPIPEDPKPSSDLHRYKPAHKQNTHTHKIKVKENCFKK